MYRSKSQPRRRYDGVPEGAAAPVAPAAAAVALTARGRRTPRGAGSPRVPNAWNLALRAVYPRIEGSGLPAPIVAQTAGPIYQSLKQQGLTGEELSRRTAEETVAAIQSRMGQLQA